MYSAVLPPSYMVSLSKSTGGQYEWMWLLCCLAGLKHVIKRSEADTTDHNHQSMHSAHYYLYSWSLVKIWIYTFHFTNSFKGQITNWSWRWIFKHWVCCPPLYYFVNWRSFRKCIFETMTPKRYLVAQQDDLRLWGAERWRRTEWLLFLGLSMS